MPTGEGGAHSFRVDADLPTDPQREPPPPMAVESSLIGSPAVHRLDDKDAAVAAIAEMVASARREALSALPAGPYPVEVLRSSWDTDLKAIRAGVRVLALYQADSVRRAEVLSYLTDFAAAGAHIRVSRRVAQRMIIIDRRQAVLAMTEDSLKPPFLLIREPALLRQMCVQFGAMWRAAHSVGTGPEDALAAESIREVVRVLADGLTDTAAARKLGISERTMRRRVSAVIDLLGASNRFDAGVKAAQNGWL